MIDCNRGLSTEHKQDCINCVSTAIGSLVSRFPSTRFVHSPNILECGREGIVTKEVLSFAFEFIVPQEITPISYVKRLTEL
jgi:hypothetical protein